MVEYEMEWCNRETKTRWCKRIEREKRGLGAFFGVAGCYRPHDQTICFGKELICTVWMHYEENQAIRFLVDVLCHEENHRIIHKVTNSREASLTFDCLFGPPFDFKANKKHLKRLKKDFSQWDNSKITAYGKMILRKFDLPLPE